MIKNELQYKRSRLLVIEIEHALSLLPGDNEFKSLHPKAKKAHENGLKRQLFQIKQELSEYDSLRRGNFDFGKLPEIEQIPRWLIQARIARGLGQEDLAKQQIQNYESTDYASASLSRIMQIAQVLSINEKDAS